MVVVGGGYQLWVLVVVIDDVLVAVIDGSCQWRSLMRVEDVCGGGA